MFQRVTRIGLVAMSAAALWGADAGAQTFDGWGWFCCSEVTGVIDLVKVPDPEVKPSAVVVKGRLQDIEVICRSPDGRSVLPTDAGKRRAMAAEAIESDDLTHWKYGRATVEIGLGEEELRDAEEDARCAHPYWHVVPGSAAPRALSLTMQSFRCVPESKHDREPCFQDDPYKWSGDHGSHGSDKLTVERAPQDTVKLSCTLGHIRRGKDLRPLHDQEYSCEER